MDIYTKIRMMLYACELLAAITGFFAWKKIRHTYWKWFPLYLLLISAIEITAESSFNITQNEAFNISMHDFLGIPLQFFFFFWLFYKNFHGSKEARWPLAGAAIYFIAWITDLVYFRNRELWFLSFSYTVGNILLVVLLIIYFIKLVTSEAIIKYRSAMMFWVCLGLLVFYLGSLPLYGMFNTLATKYPDLFNSYWIIAMCLDCTMYLLFTLTFIWAKPK